METMDGIAVALAAILPLDTSLYALASALDEAYGDRSALELVRN
jgi:hypothetical protein